MCPKGTSTFNLFNYFCPESVDQQEVHAAQAAVKFLGSLISLGQTLTIASHTGEWISPGVPRASWDSFICLGILERIFWMCLSWTFRAQVSFSHLKAALTAAPHRYT